ncbi:hypothetical protein [Pseudonocardia sp.]|uniref:hypothetical protein n=1 Tax=Pseudonocardia sp. TaxID=60912 RepID=UPI0031FC016C
MRCAGSRPIWPDLDAGIAELRRVLRPAGRLTVSWYGGEHPSRSVRRLVLPEDQLERVENGLRSRFADVRRMRTRRCTVFDARVENTLP